MSAFPDPAPTPSDQSPVTPTDPRINELWEFSRSQLPSLALAHCVGYGLLLFSLITAADLLIPPRLLNPTWELQALGGIVERVVPIGLVGAVLIFWGGKRARSRWEPIVLKSLSWLSLVAALVIFLMIPLGLLNTIRLNRQTSTEIQTRLEQQATEITQIQAAIDNANTPEAMAQVIQQLDSQGRSITIEDPEQIDPLKAQLRESVEQMAAAAEAQGVATLRQRRLALVKNSVKWNLGALVSSVLLGSIWKLTDWARSRS
jgi:hypothetical protein